MRFLWATLKHFNLRGYLYVWANLAFVAVSLPVITMPIAWAGLVRLSQLAQTSHHIDLNDFWQACKENIGRGLVLGLISGGLLWINLSNLYAYRAESGLFIWVLRGLWVGTLWLWFSVQLYVWPLLYEMEKPSLLGAMRNAVVMIILNPLFTVGLWVIIIPLALLSTVLPAAWILLTFSFFACLSASATLNRLQKAGHPITLIQDPTS